MGTKRAQARQLGKKIQLRERVRTALLTVNACALDDESDFERVLDAVVRGLTYKPTPAILAIDRAHNVCSLCLGSGAASGDVAVETCPRCHGACFEPALDATKLHEDFAAWRENCDQDHAFETFALALGFASGRGFNCEDAAEFARAAHDADMSALAQAATEPE